MLLKTSVEKPSFLCMLCVSVLFNKYRTNLFVTDRQNTDAGDLEADIGDLEAGGAFCEFIMHQVNVTQGVF